jgi:membrane protease YdiL (CAAX protease family)
MGEPRPPARPARAVKPAPPAAPAAPAPPGRSPALLGGLAILLGSVGVVASLLRAVSAKGALGPAAVLVNSAVLIAVGAWSFRRPVPALLVLAGLVGTNALSILALVASAAAFGTPYAVGYVTGALGMAAGFAGGFAAAARKEKGGEAVWVLGVLLTMILVQGALVALLSHVAPGSPGLLVGGASTATLGAAGFAVWRKREMDLGARSTSNLPVWGACLAGGLLLGWAAGVAVEGLIYAFGPGVLEGSKPLGELPWGARLILLVLLLPVAEELLFRGVFQGVLSGLWGPATGVLVTALLFAVAHASPVALPFLLLAGLTTGLARHASGSLLPGLAFHVLYNAQVLL